MASPRELTEDEVREQFLRLVWKCVSDWEKVPNKNMRERLSGLAFSLLVILDGDSVAIPGFTVCPDPHKDDKSYRSEKGKNWFPEENCNIAGELHELFYELGPKNS